MVMRIKIPTGVKYIIGIDEVGRGPLAGPVLICAVCLPRTSKYNKTFLKDFVDSKKLNHEKRLELFKKAQKSQKNGQVSYVFSFVGSALIDRDGISKALKIAIKRALKKLDLPERECMVLLDGSLIAPCEYIFQKTIIKGDDRVKIISCASVLAKVKRDKLMIRMSKKYPNYNFDEHKGYGTKKHISAIKKHGPSQIHRQSFLKNL